MKQSKSTRGYLPLLKNPAFSVFLTGRIVSELGDVLFTMATMWYILTTTNSAFAAALVPLVPALTFLLLSMPIGTIADRLPKKFTLIGTDVTRGLVVFIIFLLLIFGQLNAWEVYLANLILTIGGIMFGAAQQAALPNILKNKEQQLSVANGLIMAVKRIVTLCGYGIGGVLIAIVGSKVAILVDSVSFILSALSFLFISIPALRVKATKGVMGFIKDSSEGLKFIWKSRPLRTLILFGAFVNMIGAPLQFFTPIFSKVVLHAGMEGYGYLEAAAAVGELIGALISGKIAHKLRLGQWMALSFFITGCSLTLMTLFPSLLSAIILFGLSMGASALLNIPLITTLQLIAPDEIRGRVMTSFGLFFMSAVPIGLAVGGWLTNFLGAVFIFSIVGIVNVLSGCIVLFVKTFNDDSFMSKDETKMEKSV